MEPKSLLSQLTRKTVGFINAAQQLHKSAQPWECFVSKRELPWNHQELTQTSTTTGTAGSPAPETFAQAACKRSPHGLGNHQVHSSSRITGILPWVSAFGCAGPLLRGSDSIAFSKRRGLSRKEGSPGGTLHTSSCWATKPQLLSDQQWNNQSNINY